MTEATQTRAYNQAIIIPSLQYWVAIPKPESHLFEVTLRIQKDIISSSVLDLKMPVWTRALFSAGIFPTFTGFCCS